MRAYFTSAGDVEIDTGSVTVGVTQSQAADLIRALRGLRVGVICDKGHEASYSLQTMDVDPNPSCPECGCGRQA